MMIIERDPGVLGRYATGLHTALSSIMLLQYPNLAIASTVVPLPTMRARACVKKLTCLVQESAYDAQPLHGTSAMRAV